MNIANFEPRPLPGQPSGTERGKPPLVCNFCEWIRLIHELRQLAAAEELFHGSDNGLRIDQIVRQYCLHIQQVHPLLDTALHADQPESELVLQQFADRPDTTVAQMI